MPSRANATEIAPLPEEGDDRYQALIRAQERLKLLLEITNRVVSELELSDLLREISAIIRRVLDCNVVGVRLPDPDTGELTMRGLDSQSEPPRDLHTSLVMRNVQTVFRTRKLSCFVLKRSRRNRASRERGPNRFACSRSSAMNVCSVYSASVPSKKMLSATTI